MAGIGRQGAHGVFRIQLDVVEGVLAHVFRRRSQRFLESLGSGGALFGFSGKIELDPIALPLRSEQPAAC
jgi:hypothetical protein